LGLSHRDVSDDPLAWTLHPTRHALRTVYSVVDEKDIKLQANKETILAMLKRRPCTPNQIASAFGMHLNEVSKYLGSLIGSGLIREKRENGDLYYIALTMDNCPNPPLKKLKIQTVYK